MTRKITESDIKASEKASQLWRRHKRENKVSQKDFAKSLGWSQCTLSQYLNASMKIGDEALKKLCEGLDCNPWDIREELYSPISLDAKSAILSIKKINKIIATGLSSEEAINEIKEILGFNKDSEELLCVN